MSRTLLTELIAAEDRAERAEAEVERLRGEAAERIENAAAEVGLRQATEGYLDRVEAKLAAATALLQTPKRDAFLAGQARGALAEVKKSTVETALAMGHCDHVSAGDLASLWGRAERAEANLESMTKQFLDANGRALRAEVRTEAEQRVLEAAKAISPKMLTALGGEWPELAAAVRALRDGTS